MSRWTNIVLCKAHCDLNSLQRPQDEPNYQRSPPSIPLAFFSHITISTVSPS